MKKEIFNVGDIVKPKKNTKLSCGYHKYDIVTSIKPCKWSDGEINDTCLDCQGTINLKLFDRDNCHTEGGNIRIKICPKSELKKAKEWLRTEGEIILQQRVENAL